MSLLENRPNLGVADKLSAIFPNAIHVHDLVPSRETTEGNYSAEARNHTILYPTVWPW